MSNAAQPSPAVPMVDPKTGMVTGPWAQWFMASSNAGAEPFGQTLSGERHVASATGYFLVQGTPSTVALTRGRDRIVLDAGFVGFIPVANKDELLVGGGTYTVQFIPAGPA